MKSITFIIPTGMDDSVLKTTALTSPVFKEGCLHEILIKQGYVSAGTAYNCGIDEAKSGILVCMHGDVYLPNGWDVRLFGIIEELEKTDPNWGILGCAGVTENGFGVGHIYCGVSKIVIGDGLGTTQVPFLDGVIFILNKNRNLRFDSEIPGFNFYDVDMCLESTSKGFKNYAISNLCIHNALPFTREPSHFWEGVQYVRRKRKPIPTIKTTYLDVYADYFMMKASRERYRHTFISMKELKNRCRIQDLSSFYEGLRVKLERKPDESSIIAPTTPASV